MCQETDNTIFHVKEYLRSGWPTSNSLISRELKQFQKVATKLAEENGILLRNNRIIIPRQLCEEMLQRLHTGHLGICKSRNRARQSMWWPGMSKEILEMIQRCDICNQNRSQRPEPQQSHQFPQLLGKSWAQIFFSGSSLVISS